MTKSLTAALLLVAFAAPLGAQQGVAERLAGRVSPEIDALVHGLVAPALARGLPIDPIVQKAIEGSAKGVPADRVAAALHGVVANLDTAARALSQASVAPDTVAIAAGGFAVTAGLNGRHITELARAGSPADLALSLRVAGTLAALGVPPAETVSLVSATLRAGRAPADLLALPGRVQSEMAKGVTPAQAAAGLARSAAAQGRRGPPPDRGPPADQPGRPKP